MSGNSKQTADLLTMGEKDENLTQLKTPLFVGFIRTLQCVRSWISAEDKGRKLLLHDKRVCKQLADWLKQAEAPHRQL